MPACWHAWSTVVLAGTSTGIPLIVSFGMDFCSSGALQRGCAIGRDPLLHLRAEMPDQALHGPCRCVPQRANRMPFDLVGDIEQHVDFGDGGVAFHHALHDAPHPTSAFAARRALATAFVLV